MVTDLHAPAPQGEGRAPCPPCISQRGHFCRVTAHSLRDNEVAAMAHTCVPGRCGDSGAQLKGKPLTGRKSLISPGSSRSPRRQAPGPPGVWVTGEGRKPGLSWPLDRPCAEPLRQHPGRPTFQETPVFGSRGYREPHPSLGGSTHRDLLCHRSAAGKPHVSVPGPEEAWRAVLPGGSWGPLLLASWGFWWLPTGLTHPDLCKGPAVRKG